MEHVFDVVDKSGRKIYLSKERWKHVTVEHPEINNYEILVKVLTNPDKIIKSDRDPNVSWYYLYNKERRNYLKVSVKYLNGKGYIITAHYTSKIQ